MCFLPPQVPSLKIAKACLLQTSPLQDAQSKDTLPAMVGPRMCVAASIYMGYNGVYPPSLVFLVS